MPKPTVDHEDSPQKPRFEQGSDEEVKNPRKFKPVPDEVKRQSTGSTDERSGSDRHP